MSGGSLDVTRLGGGRRDLLTSWQTEASGSQWQVWKGQNPSQQKTTGERLYVQVSVALPSNLRARWS